MSDELVGEVRVKVRPDSTDWRREAAHDVERETKGIRAEVPIDGKLRIDQNQVQRQLDQARQRLRGGDVKIVAKVESNISAAYDEWAKASDKVKTQFSQLETQQKKWFGANDARNDSMRKSISLLAQEAGKLREQYEKLGGDTALAQARENLKLEESMERVNNAHQANLDVVEKMTANELKSYMERVRGTEDYLGAEEEYLRRLGRLRSKSNFDLQAAQARDNGEIERENRRHLDAMNRDFRVAGMPEDPEQWSTRDLVRMKQKATEGLFDAADASRISQEIQRRLSQQALNMSFDPGFAERAAQNKSALNQFMQGVDNAGIEAQFQSIRDEATKTEDHIKGMKPTIEVKETGLLGLAAQLKWASRPRHVPFYAKVDEKSIIIAEGLLKSLSGLNTLESFGRSLESTLVEFDKVSLKAAGTATVIGGLINTMSFLSAGTISVVGDLARLSGGLLVLPAAISAVAANIVIHTAAFKDFKDAIDGDEEALAALPPTARRAAEAMTGLWDRIAEPIQNRFWEGLGDELTETIETLEPILTDGLARTAVGMGQAWALVGESLQQLAIRGDLETMFDNLEQGSLNAAKAATPLVDAINTIGLRGSEYLPAIGDWMTDIATQFNDWIQAADDSGRINFWLERAYTTLEDTWRVGGNVVGIFEQLYRVSETAGAGGLKELADSLGNIRDEMSTPLWQSRMSTILAGALDGATALNEGFLDLADTIGAASGVTGLVLDQLGQLGGGVLSRVADTLGRTKLQGGILEALGGMNELLDELEPGFEGLGDVIGTFAGLAGDVFENLAPVLNGAIGLLDTVSSKVAPGLGEAVPTLTGFLSLLIDLSSGPLGVVADTVAILLEAFNGLPGPAQTAVLALAGLVALRSQFGSFIDLIGNGARTAFSGLTTEVQKQPGAFASLATAWREQKQLVADAADGNRSYAGTFGTGAGQVGYGRAALGELAAGFRDLNTAIGPNDGRGARGIRDIGEAAAGAAGHFGAAGGKGLIGAAGGLMSALGGPWGIAIAGGIAAIALFAGQAQAAKGHIEDLKASLDDDTGVYTQQTMKAIADAWTDLEDAGDPMANFTRGGKAANEVAALLGVELGNVTQMIVDGGPKFTEFVDGLKAIRDTKDVPEMRKRTDEFAAMTEKSDRAIESLKLNKEAAAALNKGDLDNIIGNIEREEAALRLSELAWKGVSEATGQTVPAAQAMADAMATIGNNSIDAAGKIDAIRTALDLLRGGTLSAQEAQMAAAKSQTQAVEQAKALAAEIAVSKDTMFDASGMLSSQSLIGQKTFDLMKSSADSLLIEAQAAYDAVKLRDGTAAEASEAAMSVMDKSDGRLQELADAMGISVETLRTQWDTFFGSDWELEAVFSASADKVQIAMEQAKQMGVEWDAAEFMAWLNANPDPAAVTTDQITQYMQGRMAEQFQANLTAINPQALTAINDTFVKGKAYSNAQYQAGLEALDKTYPGVSAAVGAIARMTGGDYAAAIKAINATGGGIGSANFDLNNLPDELVDILTRWAPPPPPPYIDPVYVPIKYVRGENIPQAADGAIIDGSNPYAGKWGMQMSNVTAFADGGLSGVLENPGGAKIYAPASTYRMFAEKVTGGEAYIPLAAAKRERSIEIWREVGRRLGVSAYEDGGMDGVSRLLDTSNTRPIEINLTGVPMDNVDATVNALRLALKQAARGGKYS